MTQSVMKYITEMMREIGIPFAFMRWNAAIPDRYWVGSSIEPVSMTRDEDGRQDSTLILQGYAANEEWMLLLRDKEALEKQASKTAILPDGTGVAVFYAGGEIVPVSDNDIVSMKINLDIQEWRVK